jgi:hypothetical protein
MNMSALQERSTEPTDRAVRAALGEASAGWTRLRDELHRACAPLGEAWQWSAPAKGWSFRLLQKKRVLVYMLPQHGSFLASFSLGAAAWSGALELRLPAAIREIVAAAPKYAEGRGVRIPVRSIADANAVLSILTLRART